MAIPKVPRNRNKKKKEIFPVDLTVFEGIQKQGAKIPEVSLQQALETLQKLGFKVTAPSSEDDIQAHQDSIDLLGITDEPVSKSRNKKRKVNNTDNKLRGVLYFSHHVSSGTYGPGNIELDISERDLFVSLLKQDQTCVQHYQEPLLPQNSRCYIVQQGNQVSNNKYRKVEVSEAMFNSNALWDGLVTFSTGNNDLRNSGIPIPQYTPFSSNNGF